MVGDAAAFLDPIISSGVYLAMKSAAIATEAIERAFVRNDFSRRAFVGYERRQRKHFKAYFDLIYKFYEPEFLDLFLHPTNKLSIQPAVNSVLAGRIEGDWRIRWRLRLFFFFVWLQKHLELAPRTDFSRPPLRPQIFPTDPKPAMVART